MTISVVYLAHFYEEAGYGIDTVKVFLDSYKKYSAGIEHSLIIAAKNWTNKDLYEQLCSLAKENNAEVINLPNDGFDFGAYFRVSKMLSSEYILLAATSTTILCKDWLLKHYNAFKNDNLVQLAAPMGSWGYAIPTKSFPNYHIRTCAFMIKRHMFLEYAATQKIPTTKEDTYKIEHGENSLTNFFLNKGFKVAVVNSDGEIFMPEHYIFSRTFSTPDADKSIFSDKHSKIYFSLDEHKKRHLEKANWGQYLNETKIKIFSSYHKITPIFLTEVLQPIFSNAENSPNRINTIKDNIGINISNKYDIYADLTGQYWAWKNYLPKTNAKYIGFCQYDKFLDFNIHGSNSEEKPPFQNVFILTFEKMLADYTEENILKCIDNFDIILPTKITLEKNVYENYSTKCTKQTLDLAIEVLENLHPEYENAIKEILSAQKIYSGLVFVMKKELLHSYFKWLFDIFRELETKETFKNGDFYNLAEIFFNIWIAKNTSNLKTLTTTSIFVPMEF